MRLPGGISTLEQLWAFLSGGGDAIRDVPEGRWAIDLYDPTKTRPGTTYVRRGGYVDGLELMDAEFFGLSAREASRVDPQQRLLLETAFEALEYAGQPLSEIARQRVGVFIGMSSNDFLQIQGRDPRNANAYTNTGGSFSIAANRISYAFDLRGPSMTIDTACSSGLTALDQAVRSINAGDCVIAVVGAANALLLQEGFVNFSAASMLSPVGQCRAFDADGAGFVRSEGAVSIVLKPLDAALRDEDPILGVIRASDVNNDGRTAGLSLPSGEAQAELLERIYGDGRIDVEDLVYVEAHGTGTAAGDPIEAGALGRVLGRQRSSAVLPIGSIKTNIGHMEPASGLAGLAKALTILDHGAIPPSLHFVTPNPKIDFADLNLTVPTAVTPIAKVDAGPKIGINSFGFGGSNAHVVVEQAPRRAAPKPAAVERPWFMISARSATALASTAASLSEHLARNPGINLHDLSGTLLTRRTWHRDRLAIWADSIKDLRAALDVAAAGDAPANAVEGSALRSAAPAFVFTGNGPQWWAMARTLIERDPQFRSTLEELDAAFRAIGGVHLIEELLRDESESRMAATEVAQPALFAVQVGLLRLLAAEGIVPGAVVGHSAGELASAYASGILDLQTVVRIVHARSFHQGKTAGTGAMAAIGLDAASAADLIAGERGLVIAGDNATDATTIAGPVEAVDHIVARLDADGVFARKLRLDYGFHSPLMDPIEADFRNEIGIISGRAEGSIPFYSTVTGTRLDHTAMDADYWWRNLRAPVRFRRAIETMLTDGHRIFVEIGPHPNLTGYVKDAADSAALSIRTIETLRRGGDDVERMRRCVAHLAVAGARFDWSRQFPSPLRPVALPAYPWQREHHYHLVKPTGGLAGKASGHALLGARLPVGDPIWSGSFTLAMAPFVADHVVRDTVLFPAAGFFEIALAAASSLEAGKTIDLNQMQIDKAMALDASREVMVQTIVEPGSHAFTIRSRAEVGGSEDEQPFVEHVRGVIGQRPPEPKTADLAAIRARMSRRITSEQHYQATTARGLHYGPAFQVVADIHVGHDELLARLVRTADGGRSMHLDPTLIDGALQAMIGLAGGPDDETLFLPVATTKLVFHASTADHDEVFAHVMRVSGNKAYLSCDILVCAADGTVLAEIRGMQLRRVGGAGRKAAALYDHCLVPLHSFHAGRETADMAGQIPAATRDRLTARGASGRRYDALVRSIAARFAVRALAEIVGSALIDIGALVASGQVARRHHAYVGALMTIAVTEGLATREEEGYLLHEAQDPMLPWREAYATLPKQLPDWLLMARFGTRLAGILRGESDPLEILFPPRGSAVSENLYEQGYLFGDFNEAARDVLARIVADAPSDRTLRVLEIGGGTGGTTASLLPVLSADRADYLFTDVSQAFMQTAENRFGNYPFFHTAVLDMSKTPDPAEFGGKFDVIVAANVIHVAADIRGVLRNLRACLAPGGTLIQIETGRTAFFDFIFGALPGAWAFERDEFRTESCLLPAPIWQQVLGQAGFDRIEALVDAGEGEVATGSLLISRSIADARPEQPVTVAAEPVTEPLMLIDLAAGSALATMITARLAEASRDLVSVRLDRDGEAGQSGFAADHILDRGDDAALAALCAALAAHPPVEIVVLAPSSTLEDRPDADEGWVLVGLLKAVAAAGWSKAPKLTLITEDLWTDESNIAAAAYWGVSRTIANEQPDWICRRLDVERSPDALARVVEWVINGGTAGLAASTILADELRFTGDGLFMLRLDTTLAVGQIRKNAMATAVDFAVSLSQQGSIDNLGIYEKAPVAVLGDRQVEVAVRAAGVNFKDIILALGMLPPELLRETETGLAMGLEAAGEIVRVGVGVADLQPGMRVMLMGDGCFASSIVVDAAAVRPIPAGMTFEDAATLPVVGLTVVYSLKMLARLQAGDTLLVHGGAGGIGLAAIQYAKAVGAKVIATVGSSEKRDLLTAIGVDLISDSRSLRFDADVRDFTGGAGVDVVLNSLAGDAMQTSLGLLKPYGRFIEIGKRDFEINNRINLKALERNISYFAVDLTFLHAERPALYREVWDALLAECEAGRMHALPYRTYPVARIGEAFRQMQAGRHIGKLVITTDTTGATIVPRRPATVAFAANGAHIITGGLGGLGLRMAGWMADHGARTIVLAGRRGITTDEQRDAVDAIEARGARVIVAAVDVADDTAVTAFLDMVRAEVGAIRGIVHSVLVLDDQMMINMPKQSYVSVTTPKTVGAWALDRLTLDDPIDYFVTLSSIATTIGNPGQAAYVAANAMLDHMMMARRAAGRHGLSLALGPIEDAGFVARNATLSEHLDRSGIVALKSQEVLNALSALIPSDRSTMLLMNLKGRIRMPIGDSQRLRHLMDRDADSTDAGGDVEKIDFQSAAPTDRAALMESVLVEGLAQVTGSRAARIDVEQSATAAGLDSLMAVELGLLLENRIGISIPMSDLVHDRSLRDLAAVLLARLGLPVEKAGATDAALDQPSAEPTTTSAGGIDWDAECRLEDDIRPSQPPATGPSRNVLLTGANGFLGAFLLTRLLDKTEANVVCLVRAPDQMSGEHRLWKALDAYGLAPRDLDRRVRVVTGDLRLPKMGLGAETYRQLAETIDTVYHSAAVLNFFQPYAGLKEANVGITREALRFACQGLAKRFHHVSTSFVFDTPALAGLPVDEATLLPSPDNLTVGYSQTKWVAEKLVQEAGRRGLPVAIYRPPFIAGDSASGAARVDDFVSLCVRAWLELGAAPAVEYDWHISPVDWVADAIFAISRRDDAFGRAWHCFASTVIPNPQLMNWMKNDVDGFAIVPWNAWLDRVRMHIAGRPDHPAASVLPFWLIAHERGLNKSGSLPLLGSAATWQVLAAEGVVPRQFDEASFSSFRTFLTRSGLVRELA